MTVAALPIADLLAHAGADSRFASAFAVLRDVATSGEAPNEMTARLASVLLDVLSVLVTDPATTTPATRHDWRTLRQRRGWTQSEMFRHLTQVAADLGEQLPSWPSFKRNLSRWENGTVAPSPYYQRLLIPLFGLAESTGGGAR